MSDTNRETVFMFSGQGSQYYQMGRPLFEGNAVFRGRMIEIDAAAEVLVGRSILDELYDERRGKADEFSDILMTSLALFAVEYASSEALIERGVVPDYVLGTSMGAFAAAVVAGCLPARDAVEAIVAHSSLVAARCEAGGMIAIVGAAIAPDDELLADAEIAAINYRNHYVVAAPAAPLERIEQVLLERCVAHRRLPVRYAFHSRWIDAVVEPLRNALRALQFAPPRYPIVCCARGTVGRRPSGDYFVDALRQPILFGRAIAALEHARSLRYIDVGPAGSLAAIAKHARPRDSSSQVHSLVTPFGDDLENLERLTAACGATP